MSVTDSDVTTARPRRRATTVIVWVLIALFIVVMALITSAIGSNSRDEQDSFDPTAASQDGTRALAEILRDHGVTVSTVNRYDDALTQADDPTSTLLLVDSYLLTDEQLTDLADATGDLVVLKASSRTADLLADAILGNPNTSQPVQPNCSLPAAQRAGPVAFSATYEVSSSAITCYRAGIGSGLVQVTRDGGNVTLVDGGGFRNAELAEGGNAALAINLLGARDTLIWYTPKAQDPVFADTAPEFGSVTPNWLTPVISLLIVTAAAAILWRGRRFGPLVAENLPVSVRLAETTEGRGRLYARAHDLAHTADQLRAGTLRRLARPLGLSATVDARVIADAAAARLSSDRATMHGVLIDDVPQNAAQLVDLSRQLLAIETAVRGTIRPGRTTT